MEEIPKTEILLDTVKPYMDVETDKVVCYFTVIQDWEAEGYLIELATVKKHTPINRPIISVSDRRINTIVNAIHNYLKTNNIKILTS